MYKKSNWAILRNRILCKFKKIQRLSITIGHRNIPILFNEKAIFSEYFVIFLCEILLIFVQVIEKCMYVHYISKYIYIYIKGVPRDILFLIRANREKNQEENVL